MERKFQVGQVYSFRLDDKEYTDRKVTKVNGTSIYFSKVRVPYETDGAGQYLITTSGRVYAYETETETIENIKEAEDMANKKKTNPEVEENLVPMPGAEKLAELKEPEFPNDYIIVKSTRDGKKLFGNYVVIPENKTVDEVINPIQSDENPTFVALVKVDKVLRFLNAKETKGITQTVRNISKKWHKLNGTEGPELDYEAVAGILNAIVEDMTRTWEAPEEKENEEVA